MHALQFIRKLNGAETRAALLSVGLVRILNLDLTQVLAVFNLNRTSADINLKSKARSDPKTGLNLPEHTCVASNRRKSNPAPIIKSSPDVRPRTEKLRPRNVCHPRRGSRRGVDPWCLMLRRFKNSLRQERETITIAIKREHANFI